MLDTSSPLSIPAWVLYPRTVLARIFILPIACSVNANLRRVVKRVLRKYGYPPDMQEKATKTVLIQAELLVGKWTG